MIWFFFGVIWGELNHLNPPFSCASDYCFPRIIWGYWDDLERMTEDIVEMIEITKESLAKKSICNFTYVFLSSDNISDFLDLSSFPYYYNSLVERSNKADYIRVCLIEKFGGIWVDVSTYVVSGKEMEWFYSSAVKSKAEIVGYGDYGHIKINFFGAPKYSRVMKLWKEEYDVALSMDPAKYLEKVHPEMKKKFPRFNFPHNILFVIDILENKVYFENPDLQKSFKFHSEKRSHYKLYNQCKGDKLCFKHRLEFDPRVRKFPFTKVSHEYSVKKKLNFKNPPAGHYLLKLRLTQCAYFLLVIVLFLCLYLFISKKKKN